MWNAGQRPRVGRRESRSIDSLGGERVFLFDKYGNPLAITDEAGARTTYSYDTAAGRTHLRLTKTSAQGQTTGYAYDSLGNLTDLTLPSGRSLQYRDYTSFGRCPVRLSAVRNRIANRLLPASIGCRFATGVPLRFDPATP